MNNTNTNSDKNKEKSNSYHHKEKEIRDKVTKERSLWNRLDKSNLTEEKIAFFQNCMTENLNHARHAENERLTFNTVYLALVAGALAFASEFLEEAPLIAFFIYLTITLAGFLSMLLTIRWNNTFERHTFYAKECYKIIHEFYFGDNQKTNDTTKEAIEGLNDLPMYSFNIHNPIPHTPFGKPLYKVGTRTLYNLFYWTVQLLLIACTLMAFFKYIGA